MPVSIKFLGAFNILGNGLKTTLYAHTSTFVSFRFYSTYLDDTPTNYTRLWIILVLQFLFFFDQNISFTEKLAVCQIDLWTKRDI